MVIMVVIIVAIEPIRRRGRAFSAASYFGKFRAMADEPQEKPSPAEIIWRERRWPPQPLPEPAKKPSSVETAKLESNFLRGTIAQELTDGNTSFSKGNA